MKAFGQEIKIGVKGVIITLIVGALGTGIGWVGTTLWEGTSFHKYQVTTDKLINDHKKYRDSVNAELRNTKGLLNEHHTRLVMVEDHITAELNRETFAVGLRYNIKENKLYYRTSDKKLREVQADPVNGDNYYRDENDKRVYINAKY